MSSAKAKIDELQALVKSREAELARKESELRDKAKEADEARSELAARKTQLEMTSEMLRKATAEKAAARSEQALLAQQLQRAEQAASGKGEASKAQAAAETNARARAAAEALALRRLSDCSTRLHAALAQRDEIEAMLQRRSGEFDELRTMREAEQATMAEAQRRLEAMEAARRAAEEEADQVNISLAAVSEREQELATALAEAKDGLNVSEKSIERLKAAQVADTASVEIMKVSVNLLEKAKQAEAGAAQANALAAKQLGDEVRAMEAELVAKAKALADLERVATAQRAQIELANSALELLRAEADAARGHGTYTYTYTYVESIGHHLVRHGRESARKALIQCDVYAMFMRRPRRSRARSDLRMKLMIKYANIH
jgi:chromosome segregation ATPase